MHGSVSAISATVTVPPSSLSNDQELFVETSTSVSVEPGRESPTPCIISKTVRKGDKSRTGHIRPVSTSARNKQGSSRSSELHQNIDVTVPELSLPNPTYCPPTPVAFPVFNPQYMYSSVPTLYGQVHSHTVPGSIILYTSSAIPPNTTSIILIPPPQPLTTCPSTTGLPEDACSSTSETSLTILIERNAFKQWLDSNVPKSVSEFPRLKRYKSVETFMRWITAKKKHWDIPLTIIMRVTEVRNLLSELGKEFPPSIISQRVLRNIYAYEHLFSLASTTTAPSLTARWSPPAGINISHCLDDACKLALLAQRS